MIIDEMFVNDITTETKARKGRCTLKLPFQIGCGQINKIVET
jgi:hypothetical protein